MCKRVKQRTFLRALSTPLCAIIILYPFLLSSLLVQFRQHHRELHGWKLCIFNPAFTRCSIGSHILFFIASLSRLLPSVTHEILHKAGEAQCDLPAGLSFPL